MTSRSWTPCEFELDGIRARIRHGDKQPAAGDHQDLVMEWQTPTGWVAITCRTLGILTDFLAWNESGLYPPPRYKGGLEIMEYINLAYSRSWRHAEARLQAQKDAKRAREDGAA